MIIASLIDVFTALTAVHVTALAVATATSRGLRS